MRESEIHFSRWIFDRKEKNWLNITLISLILHVIFFLVLHYIKPKPELITTDTSSISPIKVDISNPNKEQNFSIEGKSNKQIFGHKKNKQSVLTDVNPKAESKFFSKNQLSSKHELDKKEAAFDSKKREKKSETKAAASNTHSNSLNSFLPSSNNNYLDHLRQESQNNSPLERADGGDIPIAGPSLAPTNQPRVLSRYVEKDMSLFQFSQEFRERFSAVWNSEDRVVPPTSPLRPGDLVYYRVYIRSNGTLERFENLAHKIHPLKDYSDTDKLFAQVVTQVFPMSVPPKFARKNILMTQDLAIQVVDRNMPARFSF